MRKLLPGHLLKIQTGSLQKQQYWDIESRTDTQVDIKTVESNLLELLKEAVSRQLMSDVPVGAFLSGGLDSSVVVALMSQLSSKPIKTFSIGFPEAGYSELMHSRIVANHFGTDHYELTVNPNDEDLIVQAILALDEPLGDDSIVPTLLVSRLASEHVKVVLSGDGGDELFAGYNRYRADRIACLYERIPRATRSLLIEPFIEWLPQNSGSGGIANSLKGLIKGVSKPKWLGHARWLTYLSSDQKRQLYHRDFLEALNGFDSHAHIKKLFAACPYSDRLSRQIYTDFKSYLPDDILTKVDRMSMAVSLEVRPPFLDNNLVSYLAGLPSELKLKGFRSKYILKRVAKNLLPQAIISRKKSGFSMPVKNWLRCELRPLLDGLGGSLSQHGPFFNEDYVQRLIDEHDTLRTDHSHILWTLIVFNTWCGEKLCGSKRN